MTHALDPGNAAVAAGLSALTAALSWKLKFLTLNGAAAAFLLGTVVFGIGGWIWAAPLLTFFVSSSVLSKLGRKRNQDFDRIFEKGTTRDAGQVFCNGGPAGAVVVLNYLFPAPYWYAIFLGIVAAVTCDTWATEIGIFFRRAPRHVLNFSRMEPGSSGGLTVPGTLGGLAGAGLIAASAVAVLPGSGMLPIVASGLAGCLADSVAGAVTQAHYLCEVCGRITEQKYHCGKRSVCVLGVEWIDNDFVNLICALAGGLSAAAIYVTAN